jgi:hypothetical protein
VQEQTEKLKWYSMMYHHRRALDSDWDWDWDWVLRSMMSCLAECRLRPTRSGFAKTADPLPSPHGIG